MIAPELETLRRLTVSQIPASAKPLLRALRGERQIPPPFWLMRQAGRYLPEYRQVRRRAGGFLDLCYAPALAAEVTLQPVRRFGVDAAILFSDILVVPHALGVDVRFTSRSGPRLMPLSSAKDIAALRTEGFGSRIAPVYEAVERVAGDLPEGVALIGFAGAPWTVAAYMVEGKTSKDFAAAKTWAVRQASDFQRLVDVLVEATVEHLVSQARHGADAVQIFDSWAGVLSESEFMRWCVAPTRAIVDRFRAACPAVPVIGFPRGAGLMLRKYAEATGVDAVGLGTGVPTEWAAKELQPRWPVQGNLDPVHLLVGGDAMRAEAGALLDTLGRGPFVFNLGHGVLPKTPVANVALLARIVRAWRG